MKVLMLFLVILIILWMVFSDKKTTNASDIAKRTMFGEKNDIE
jgi:hypothetical protein